MKQPSSKPLTVRSILVVVGLIALNVVLILAYLYFIHYPIPHSAYASGDPGRLDAQYAGATRVDQWDNRFWVILEPDGSARFLAIERAPFFYRYRITSSIPVPKERPCTLEFVYQAARWNVTIDSANRLTECRSFEATACISFQITNILAWGAYLVIAMVIVELVAYHLLKKLLHKRTSP